MKRLVRLLLINWYRIDQLSIDIAGHTAVIGPNASGKSSLLDAVQAVLVGGHKDWWRPNASAGEKSTRSLRDYCLGVVRDPDNQELSAEFKPRPHAVTHLVLVFRDDSGESTSVGISMHAKLEESSEQIDGRFIAPGLDLQLSDLTQSQLDGEQIPMPWLQLRDDLRRRAGSRLILEKSPEKFQQQICAALSDGRRHLDRKRFLRAFRNAITFAPIKNVSDFVRGQILEERDIQVKALQQALRNYREIRRRTQEAERREKALQAINELYRKSEQAERLALAWRWVVQEAGFNALEAQLEPLIEAVEKREKELDALERELSGLDEQWRQADQALQDANTRLAQTDVAQRRETLQAKLDKARTQLEQVGGGLTQARLGLARLFRILDHEALLDAPELYEVLKGLGSLLPRADDLFVDDWPLDAQAVQAATARTGPLLRTVLEQRKTRRNELILQVSELENSLKELRTRIERMHQTGGSDLSDATRRLQELLIDRGIDAVPLCDRIEVADEDWRDALEAFLGGHREALLVAPERVRDAILIYRREGRRLGIHGSRIVNTGKTDEWLHRCSPGSLAEVIRSDDRHAVAYINRRAGNVLRVDGEDELKDAERAITRDGMLATGGAITRLRPLDPMLGRAAREQALQARKEEFQRSSSAFSTAKTDSEAMQSFIDDILVPFRNALDNLPDLPALSLQRQELVRDIKALQEENAALRDDREHQRLQQAAENAVRHRDDVDERRKQTRQRQDELKHKQADERRQAEDKDKELNQIDGQRRLLEEIPGFDAQLAGERLAELEEQQLAREDSPEAWQALSDEAEQRARNQTSAMHKRRNGARDQLREYLASWPSEQPPAVGLEDDYRPMAAWVAGHLTDLKDTELSRFAREADSAWREAETAFRADFVGKLQENLHLLESQRRELNANLRRRPFHGQYYHFVKKVDKELEPVLKWVESWTPEQAGDVGGLFDSSNDPGHPHHEGIERIKTLLLESGDDDTAAARGGAWDERLSDYRRYYHFDVKMTDDQDGEKNAEMLSRRLGKGSGGEHQSPFYVAIGAALAAAYRIERDDQGGFRGGMGLAVFDEAFSKLDLQNTVSALGFLDELGLQVLLAAPDEKYGQIAEHVDTIINVYRDGGDVYIDAEYIKPAARAVLAGDNPVHRPAADAP